MRVNEPSISVTKKTNEENIAAIKSCLGEVVDAINLMSNMYDNLSAKVAALESEED